MLLDAIDKSIQVVLGGAATTTNCPVTAFYVDHTDAGGTPGSSDTATNGATAVTVVAAPAADTERQVKMITVYNADTAAVTVYTQFLHGMTTRIMNQSTLAVGESLIYQNEIGFRIGTPTGTFLSDISDRAARLLGVISGAVTTDALKSSDLNIDASEKLLEVAITDAVARILLNTALPRLQTDVAGRLLVKIDVAGTSTPVTTATHAVTVASGGIASGAVASGAIALGAIATGAITDLPYKGWDHEGYLSQMAFNGIRDRMEFTI